MRKNKYSKLSPRYYGPFLVQQKVGAVAYKLKLLSTAQIHDVFHVSQLKKCRGAVIQQGDLPTCDAEGVMLIESVAVLDRRLAKKGNGATVFVLIQWANGSKEDATWEPTEEIQRRFPTFDC